MCAVARDFPFIDLEGVFFNHLELAIELLLQFGKRRDAPPVPLDIPIDDARLLATLALLLGTFGVLGVRAIARRR